MRHRLTVFTAAAVWLYWNNRLGPEPMLYDWQQIEATSVAHQKLSPQNPH
jgi:predicted anti-sigma-YlaC factor YlaD